MSVNVNVVYQTVLNILNKEQRGYLTPAEFNDIGKQVQLEIFEKYFEDMNQFLRVPQTDSDYANRVENLDEKIAIFKTSGELTRATTNQTVYYSLPTQDIFNTPVDFYRLGTLSWQGTEIQRVGKNEYYNLNKSPLTKPTEDFPVYSYEGEKIFISPELPSIVNTPPSSTPITSPPVNVDFVREPVDPVWAFIPGIQGQYVYDSSANSVNFELHPSEQTELVLKILLYAGVVIRDPQIVQQAAGAIQKQEIEQKS